jgi:predicted ferric reductase
MTRVLSGLFWLAVYLAVVLSPLLLMLLPPTPAGRAFSTELSAALGFIGLAQMGLQFVLIARFRPVTEPYGIDIILQYHRQIGLASLALVSSHAVIAIAERPALLGSLWAPGGGRTALLTGLASILAFVLLAGLSLGRRRLRLGYEAWRVSHALLGLLMLGLATAHVVQVGHYVSSGWKRFLWVLFAALMAGVLAYLRLLQPLFQRSRPYRVVGVEPDRGRTWILAVEPEGHPGMRFLPGQFAWIKLGDSAYTIQEHPFSFSSSAEVPERLEFGIKELGDFTAGIGETRLETRAYLDGPHGSMSIDRYPAAGYVFIAGGIGITPIVSMLRTMADRDDRRPALLIYADDAWENMPFRDEIEALAERIALDVVWVLESPPEAWQGETGWVTAELLERHLPDERIQRHFFVCGPNPMIRSVESSLHGLGVPSRLIEAERFTLV